jgi:high-affinity iron transporter
MLAALIIVFREVIEAGLVIGIVLAATQSVAGRGRWVAAGTLAGVVGAGIVALLAGHIAAAFSGVGQEIFNAAILAAAVLMLAWHNIWMARHGRALSTQFKNLGAAVKNGNRTLLALAIVVGVAVLREGMEIVLFLYGITVSNADNGTATLIGGLAGVGLGGIVTVATYFGLVRIPARHLFRVTSILITLLAAGMAASAVGYLQQADLMQTGTNIVWDSSNLLPQSTLLGTSLHALIGYTDQPTALQLAAYALTLLAISFLTRFYASPRNAPLRS